MIVVTAPTGNIGSRLLRRITQADEPVRVVARDPGRLPAAIRGRVEVVQGSHGDADVVDKAFAGAGAVFWLVPADRRAPSAEAAYAGFARPGIEALARHGVRHVVGISALGRGTDAARRAGHVTATLAMDDLIAATGVHYRALAAATFMDNTLRSIPAIRAHGTIGGFPIPADRALPAVATCDIAAVAAGLLLDRSWAGVEDVPLRGPEDLSGNDMAGIVSDVLGTPVRYEPAPAQALKEALLAYGTSGPMAQAMVDMALAKAEGLDDAVPHAPRTATPTTFRQWCENVLAPAYRAAGNA